jgi:UPF0148 protein
MEDKDLEKVTKMLERGGTMLAKHCECGAPLFKYQGKVVCPVCDAKRQEQAQAQQQAQEQTHLAIPVETKPAVQPQSSVQAVREEHVSLPEHRMTVIPGGERLNEEALEAAIIAKVNEIAARLATEEYPNKIQMYLDILERSLRVLKELHGVTK